MMTMPAKSLQAGDEFTSNDGETWVKVKVVREACRGLKVVVIGHDGKERIFDGEDLILLKI